MPPHHKPIVIINQRTALIKTFQAVQNIEQCIVIKIKTIKDTNVTAWRERGTVKITKYYS